MSIMRSLLLWTLLPALLTFALPNKRDSQSRLRKRMCQRRGDSTVSLNSNSTSSPLFSPAEASTGTSDALLPQATIATLGLEANEVLATSARNGFNYGSDKIRGVNLGGWLVLESFLTPSIFSNTGNGGIVDEWTFCQYQDRATAKSALHYHWSTFITEDDFRQITMAEANLNHVRIPVGYWAWDIRGDEPYISGAADYLDKAVDWARKHGLKILLDLHGAPGSQNGYDHSGRVGPVDWYSNPVNVRRTVDLVWTLAQKYGAAPYSDTVTMIELLNEPALFVNDDIKRVTRQFYLDAYEVARWPLGRDGAQTDWVVVIHDGFQPLSYWADFMVGDQYENVWIDTHYYQAFDQKYFGISAEQHIREVCSARSDFEGSHPPSIAGEWAISVWSCASSEGKGVGDCNLESGMQEYPTFLRAYSDIQAQIFEHVGKGQGWFFFNWKTEALDEWAYQKSLANGWIP